MRRLIRHLWESLTGKRQAGEQDAEELRIAFRNRYQQFKLLLSANSAALDTMAEMEEALRGTRPFGMPQIRAWCTRVSTDVFQIVRYISQLAPGKYDALQDRFREIQQQINGRLEASSARETEGPLVIPLERTDKGSADLVGWKMANLGEIGNRIGRAIPRGFVITTRGYRRFLEHNELQAEIARRLQITKTEDLDELYRVSSQIQQLIIGSALPEDLETAIREHSNRLLREAGPQLTLALRSSARGEDLEGTSFAGQYQSELNVSPGRICRVYREIVASLYGLTAMSYRLNRGLRDEDIAMSVGCLQMVDATAGGVVYSRNPIDPRDDTLVVNAVWGLPKTVVDGTGDADVFVTSRESSPSVLRREIAVKTHQLRCHPDEGLIRREIAGDRQSRASLTDDQVLEIALLAIRLEEHYGTPQDIEWAVDPQGTVIVLQSRPLPAAAAADRSPDREPDAPPALLEGGITASPGTGAGPVFIVRKDADLLLFPAGAVLAAVYPAPRLAPLLGRAAGVIAEHGGVAGHLASVAREFRVPALFGIQGALQRLEPGQWVTLDADRGRVHAGRIEALLSRAPEKPQPMEGTPVGALLTDIARHVVPLNLLDPDAPAFTPGNCRTLHDITRFCHEKVVEEMFQFGRDHHFPERSSKQLVCQVPMQWWVLNLDDGFREEVRGRQVKLENIVSLPMLALWEGITAFPWEGPPPVDGKGFLSVMFEATANRALVAGVRSSYGQRNYFMISRNYCSLTSRLGFHFSEVEALVGERLEENYLSFLFKGGAADFDRRFRRVHFIREILEEFGFRVALKEDHLDARVQDHPVDFMLTRLKILGHLTIHTRQLDMIMANETAVRHYRAKILEQLQSLLGGEKAPPAPGQEA